MSGPFTPPPVALRELSVENFRGIDRLELNFCGPDGLPNGLVVLAGPNGCGKTAVLEAGLIAAGGHKLITGLRGPSAVRRGQADYQITAQFEVNMQHSPVVDSAHRKPPPPVDIIPFWYFPSWRSPRLVGPVDSSVHSKPKFRRTDPDRLLDVKQRLVNLANQAAFRLFMNHKSRSFEIDESSDYYRFLKLINENWSTFYPGSVQRFEVDLVPGHPSVSKPFDVFLVAKGVTPLEVDLLSAGQIELFLFLAELILNDDREGIVFIDEPELHLDPLWHRPLIRSLRKLQPKAQFIVTTHSQEIFDAAQSFERHFLVPDDDPRARLWGPMNVVAGG